MESIFNSTFLTKLNSFSNLVSSITLPLQGFMESKIVTMLASNWQMLLVTAVALLITKRAYQNATHMYPNAIVRNPLNLFKLVLAFPRRIVPFFLAELHVSYGKSFMLGPKVFVTSDAAFMKKIYKDNVLFRRFDHFTNLAYDLFGSALFLLHDEKWKRHRQLLMPAFGPNQLRQSAWVSAKVMHEAVRSIKSHIQNDQHNRATLNMKTLFSSITLEIIGRVAFGYEVGSIKKIDQVKDRMDKGPLIGGNWHIMDDCTFEPMRLRTLYPSVLWPLLGVASFSPDLLRKQAKFKEWYRKLLENRREYIRLNGKSDRWNMDVLERLIVNDEMTDDEMFGELLGFFLAGHETTANTLNFFLIEYYANPVHAQRLYESVKDVSFDNADVNPIETLGHLKYLDNFLKEVQRLHPIVPLLPRISTDVCEIGGQVFPKGTMFLGNIQQVQRNPEYFKDPLVFNPDRWSEDVHTPGSFMTFGDGPHQCVGMRMALIELRIIIIELVKNFKMEAVPGHTISVYSTITTGIREGLVSDITLRDQTSRPHRPPKVPASEIICNRFDDPAPSPFISSSKAIIRLVPALTLTVLKHYTVGPIRKEWDLGYSILVQFLKTILFRTEGRMNVNEIQRSNRRPAPVPPTCSVEQDAFFTNDSVIDFLYHSTGSGEFASPANQIIRVQAEWVRAKTSGTRPPSAIILLIHGGGMVFGSPAQHRGLAHSLSRFTGGIPVFSIDYRLAPQHPYPCALIDCVSAFIDLQSRFPDSQIVVAGDSAGGNLGLAMLQVLADMNKGENVQVGGEKRGLIRLPAACFLISPWLDLEDSLGHLKERAETDYVPSLDKTGRDPRLAGRLHAHVHDSFLDHRYVSPINGCGEIVKTCVPLYILAGEGERLHDQILAFAQACVKVAKKEEQDGEMKGKEDKNRFKLELGVYNAHTHDFPMFEAVSIGARRSLERAGTWITQQLSFGDTSTSKLTTYAFNGDLVSCVDL